MELNTEQIGIRTTKAIKMQFEAVEGSTSGEKLNNLLETYISLKNAPQGDIVANSIELLDMLKVNLAKLEKVVKPEEEEEQNETQKVANENEKLRNELELIKGKYNQLNKEYGNLILKLELKGIKL